MTSPRTLPLLAIAAALLLAPAAEAKTPSSATYLTTIKAQMEESWSFRDYWHYNCEVDAMCTRDENGDGKAAATITTRKRFPIMVIKGYQGRPPTLNLGSDGIPVTAKWQRSGQHSIMYSGAWDAGNEDQIFDNTGCGEITQKTFASVGWSFETPNALQLIADSEPLRDNCPTQPGNVEWVNDEYPSLIDILAKTGKSKFLRTKQFTVRGTKTFVGTVPAVNTTDPEWTKQVGGEHKVTWTWRATFQKKKRRK